MMVMTNRMITLMTIKAGNDIRIFAKRPSMIPLKTIFTGYGIPLEDPVTSYEEPAAVPAPDSYGVIILYHSF